MEKILTVSVAAYNVEKFIRQNLDSMTDPEVLDLLEVFIVDDGGTDSTFAIAKEYEERWPDTFHVVHKENGGYGSTVNYSIDHATGKYFRLLDGDDWLDSDGLKRLLSNLLDTEADIVASQYYYGDEELKLRGTLSEIASRKVYKVSDFCINGYIGMWELCIKTDILRKCEMKLPEHTLYTDQFFATIPFENAETILYCDFPVYCYRVGREEQSVSKASRIKHYRDALDNCKALCIFCRDCKGSTNYNYILHRVSGYYRSALRTILLLGDSVSKDKFISFENEIKTICRDVYEEVLNSGKFGRLLKLNRLTQYRLFFILKHLNSEWV